VSAIAEILALVNGNPNKTLDELILGEKTFVATSDTTLKVLGTITPISASATPTGRFSFIPKLSGTINIRIISPIVTGQYGPSPLKLIVFKDNVQISTYTFEQSEEEQTIYLHSINIVKDAEYSFAIQKTSGGLSSQSNPKLEISAIVADSNYYE
jgi:hypothetical protein